MLRFRPRALSIGQAAALLPVLWLLACSTLPPDEETPAIAGAGFAAESVGYLLFDLESGTNLAGLQQDRPFVPASVTKVPTVAAALAALGPDHRFATTLHGTGPLRGGTLEGDLILKGGGDPSLTTAGLMDLAGQLRTLGLTRITGRFLFDTTTLPEVPEIDPAQPRTAGYNTGVGALSVNYNRVQRVRTRGRSGEPGVEHWSLSDAGRHRLDRATLDHADLDDPSLSGPDSADAAKPVWLPVRRPGPVAAALFRQVAAEAGIALPAPAAGLTPPEAALLARHDSAPLVDLSRDLLRYSNNLSAELIGLGAARGIDPMLDLRSDPLGRSAALLSSRLMVSAGPVDWQGFVLANHSGLTTMSRMTPRQTAALLRAGGPALWDLLPGEDEGRAPVPGTRAKSGTLAYAKALAGTLEAASGRRLGFALFIGDEAARRAFDAAMDRSRPDMPPEARAWIARARALQAELLALWARRY